MDKTTLVGPDIAEARRFIEMLIKEKVALNAALWQRDEILGRWELVLVMPLVEKLGVKEAYRRLDDILSKAVNRPEIDLLNVELMTPHSGFYKSLRRELRNSRDLFVNKQPVGDHVIDDGFIYFVK